MELLAQNTGSFGENFQQLIGQAFQALASQTGLEWLWRTLAALLILIIGRYVARLAGRIVSRALTRSRLNPTLNAFLVRVVQLGLFVVALMAALERIGVQTTSLVALIGAAGLAIGLALQSSLSNFAAGIMIILFRTFQLGDSIEAGSVAGVVEEISIFTTKLRTGDNRTITVPNSTFISQPVTNANAKPTRRIDLTIGISYNDNIKAAKDIIQKVLAADNRVLWEPAPTVAVANLGDNSVDIVVRPWVKTEDYWAVRFYLLETLKTELEANGCSIPYPQRDVHIFHATSK